MANKFQALLALLGKNKQAQGQAPVNNQYQGLAQMLPQLQDGLAGRLPQFDSNALAQRNGTVNLGQGGMNPNSTVSLNQGGMNPQTHPLLNGIKQGAKKAKHYLLDPVYNTPTGDASIDATDPRKLTDSRLGRFAVNALTGLAQQYQNPDNPLAGAFGAYSAGTRMRQNDLAEYQGRLGRKADLDTYKQLGMQVNPLASKEAMALSVKQQGVNRQNKANASVWASPKETLKRYAQPSVKQNADGRYSSGISESSPFEYVPESTAINQQQSLQQQQQNQNAMRQQAQQKIELDRKKQQFDFILNNKKFNLSQQEFAQKERQFQQKHGLDYQEFQLKVSESKKQKPQETSQLERAFANGYIDEQTFVNTITNAPRNKRTGKVLDTPLAKKATPKQTTAQKALLPASNSKIKSKEGKAFIELLGGAGL